jgi:hypothetical protein
MIQNLSIFTEIIKLNHSFLDILSNLNIIQLLPYNYSKQMSIKKNCTCWLNRFLLLCRFYWSSSSSSIQHHHLLQQISDEGIFSNCMFVLRKRWKVVVVSRKINSARIYDEEKKKESAHHLTTGYIYSMTEQTFIHSINEWPISSHRSFIIIISIIICSQWSIHI